MGGMYKECIQNLVWETSLKQLLGRPKWTERIASRWILWKQVVRMGGG
jgi:hypothetical protein